MKDQLIIFDTTMRDGEQSPGASMTREEKLRIGRQLERMRVDVIESGFPAASKGDLESVKAVAQTVKDSRICALARATDTDIRLAGEAVKPANAARIHTFIATSPIHMERKLRLKPEQVIEQDVNVFRGARLVATSERDLFASGVLPTRTPDDVYRAIVLQRLPSFVREDAIGGFTYMLAAAPVRFAEALPVDMESTLLGLSAGAPP